MKYIKTYESNKFEPGTYMIYPETLFKSHDRKKDKKYIYLVKILINRTPINKISVHVIDYLSNLSNDSRNLKGEKHVLEISKITTILYKSKSLEDAQERFDKLKEQKPYSDWIIEEEMNKYNL